MYRLLYFMEPLAIGLPADERWRLAIATLLLGVLALVLAYLSVGLLRRWAERKAMLDYPNERSSHTRPTPRGGGLAVAALSTGGLILTWFHYPAIAPISWAAYLVAAWLVAGISWLDDLWSLSRRIRIAIHSLAAILAIMAFGHWRIMDIVPMESVDLGWFALMITFFWIVGLTNAYNFMDGIDGLAGGQAVVAGIGWTGLGWLSGIPLVSLLAILLTTSCLGFLGHNWPPARIFMGDVGSTFLGFTFAVLTVVAAQHDPRLAIAGALLVWPFVFDASFTFLSRLRHGENVFSAHRSHLYQRLVIAGHSHRFVTLLYVGLASVGVVLSIGLLINFPLIAISTTIGLPTLCLGLWFFVTRCEMSCRMKRHSAYNYVRSPRLMPSFLHLPNLNDQLLHLRNRHFLAVDLLCLLAAPTLSLIIRLEGVGHLTSYVPALLIFTSLGLSIRLPIFYGSGLYHRFWRYASVDDLYQILFAVTLSSTVLALVFYLAALPLTARTSLFNHMTLPRSIPLIDAFLVAAIAGGTRFAVRVVERRHRPGVTGECRNVLIMGAGATGVMIVREIERNPDLGLIVVGYVDDDTRKHDMSIGNLPVLGSRSAIPSLTHQFDIKSVIIAMPRATGVEIRHVAEVCRQAGVEARTVPGMYELIGGTVDVSQIRPVQIDDLLRRAPVQTDLDRVQQGLAGRRVLVTGGGGSIGSELCRQILRCGPSELTILGHGEHSVFDIVQELERTLQAPPNATSAKSTDTVIRPLIADIRFPERIQTLFYEMRPEMIFHAAAHKHVPLMELNPVEAITNNVLGTQNVVCAALAADVERLVMISTDKAVNPTNIMGGSKRAGELIVLEAAQRSGKNYGVVRFGNVLGSRGSVLHTFKRQIANGGPVTITHPDMQRYFMTVPEAVQLVLQASILGEGGEVFMLDMGAPVRIADMARDLIRLSGLEAGEDVEIVFTSPRPGEKLVEELFVPGEDYRPTRNEKIFIVRNASKLIPQTVQQHIGTLASAAKNNDRNEIISELQRFVPEYRPLPATKETAPVPASRTREGEMAGALSLTGAAIGR